MPLENQPLLHDAANEPAALEDQLTRAKAQRYVENDVIPETAPVGRQVGWASAYILVISRVIGSGIFAMPGTIVQNVGSPGLALVLWVGGALIAWAGLAVDLEFGCMLPRSGGAKVYLEYTYRYPRFLASTLVAVQAVLLGFSATNCIVFAKYFLFAINQEPTDFSTKTLALSLLLVVTVIHSCFYKTGVLIQDTLGWLKVGLIVFMVLTGLFVTTIRGPQTDEPSALLQSGIWDDTDWSWNNISTALFKIAYSYAGLNNLNNVLNEVKNPVRTLKSVAPLALLTACFMYLLVNVAYFSVVPLHEIKQSRELIAALFFERVFGAGFGNVFLPLAIALSAVGNVMVVTFSLARLNQEVARQGFLPFSKILASSRPFNAPMGGLIVHFIPSMLVIITPPSSSVYAFIAEMEGYAGQYFFLALAIGILILRYRRPELTRPFRAWRPAVWLRIVTCIALIVAPLFPPEKGSADTDFFYATYAIVGVAILFFGVCYWIVLCKVLPKYRGYQLEEEADILEDGTVITRLVHKDL